MHFSGSLFHEELIAHALLILFFNLYGQVHLYISDKSFFSLKRQLFIEQQFESDRKCFLSCHVLHHDIVAVHPVTMVRNRHFFKGTSGGLKSNYIQHSSISGMLE